MFNLAVISHFSITLQNYQCNIFSQKKSSRGVRKFAKCLGKHLCQSLFFDKVAGLPVNFMKFLRTSFFIEHLWWLFLFSVETVSSFALLFFLNAFFKLSKTFKTFLL